MIDIAPAIEANFHKVLEDHTAGDPMRLEVKWTNLSRRQIAKRMKDLEHFLGMTERYRSLERLLSDMALVCLPILYQMMWLLCLVAAMCFYCRHADHIYGIQEGAIMGSTVAQ